MAYATSANLVERFGEAQLLLLADRDNDSVLDTAVIAGVIAGATSIVDLALRGRYALPLSPLDQVITEIVCDLARRRLYGQATEVPESVLDADKAARELLKQIASGSYLLTAAAPASGSDEGSANDVETSGDEPFFTSDKLSEF